MYIKVVLKDYVSTRGSGIERPEILVRQRGVCSAKPRELEVIKVDVGNVAELKEQVLRTSLVRTV